MLDIHTILLSTLFFIFLFIFIFSCYTYILYGMNRNRKKNKLKRHIVSVSDTLTLPVSRPYSRSDSRGIDIKRGFFGFSYRIFSLSINRHSTKRRSRFHLCQLSHSQNSDTHTVKKYVHTE